MKTLEALSAQLQGIDPQAMRADDVSRFLEAWIEPMTATEEVSVFDALDRVLAADIVSPISVPPHDNSAMDGFAFDGSILEQANMPLQLRVVGTALAGAAWQGTVGSAECVRIMTGAVMPQGLDTVVPQELTSGDGTCVQFAANAVRRGDNRRLLGEDLLQGTPALRRGQWLTPAALGLIASLGLATVPVVKRLRVAYFSTGDEILSLGEPLRQGAVYDSNRYTVNGLLRRLGCQVIDMGVVRDDPVLLRAAFAQAAASADVIITSGGVSVGEADFTKQMMRELGDVAFWKIAMRPGRPMALGRVGSAALFGLPGNPVAVMVTFLAFVRPALLRMMGCTDTPTPLLRARSSESLRKKPGRTEYQRGIVTRAADGTLSVRTTGNQGSGVLSSMVQANGLIVLGHTQGTVFVGDEVDVLMFSAL